MTPETLQDFVEQRLRALDPSIDLSPGSPAQTQLVQPLLDFMGADPFSMPVQTFIQDRMAQEYPSLDGGPYSGVQDVAIKGSIPALGALRTQVDLVRRRQSVANPASLTEDDVDALVANWYVSRREGEKVRARVRVYYPSPRSVSLSRVNRFYTNSGLNYYPPHTQTITAAQMTTQRTGSLYYVDVLVEAEKQGTQYAVGPGEISNVVGLSDATRVTNLAQVQGGAPRETNAEVLVRTRRSLTERSMVSARGIFARLMSTYPSIRNLEVVGFGDPEMGRDVITGGGYGKQKASGTCFVFGTFCLLLTQYEDRDVTGTDAVEVGDTINLNYWGLLYGLPDHQQHETFTITNIVFSSRSAAPSFPTIYLFQMNGEPTPTSTLLGGFPGLLPAVFASVTGPGKIEVSDIPGGILQPTTERGTLIVDDGEIHIGGKADVWVRPLADSVSSYTPTLVDEASPLLSRTLTIDGLGATPNIVSSTDPTLDWLALGVQPGHYLVILDGADAGTYGILRVSRDELVLDTDLTTTDSGLSFRIADELDLDLVDSRWLKVPFGLDAPGDDLETTVGLDTVRLGTNLLTFQVQEGDILRILEGPDEGDYEITSFETALGGAGPQLDRMLTASNSGLTYEVFTAYGGISRPLVRVEPAGVQMLDAAGQPSDITVPPALPVDGRNPSGFTGAAPGGSGTRGFVMPDLTPTFEPLEDVMRSRLELFGLNDLIAGEVAGVGVFPSTSAEVIDLLNAVVGGGCYSDGCLPCDGYTVVVSFDSDGIRLHTSLTPGIATYWNTILDWFQDTFNAFFPSQPVVAPEMDEDGIFVPWPSAMDPADAAPTLMQFELCLPAEFFNCCNDIFMAFPEFSVEEVAAILGTINAANWPDKLSELSVALDAAAESPLCSAEPGDVLTIASGPNAGGYAVRDLHQFVLAVPIEPLDEDADDVLAPGGTITLQSYQNFLNQFWGQVTICAVSIRGEFAIGPCGAFWDLFQEGLPDLPDLPEPPAFDGYCYDDYGNLQDPFDWIVAFFAWLIDFLGRLGLDVPEDILDYLGLEAILLALSDLIFVDYTIGHATCCNTVRVYFTEPTTVEVDSGGECVILYADEEDDIPITIYAGQPTLWSAVVGAEELLYAPCHDAPAHQVYPSKVEAEDHDEKLLPRHIETVSQGLNSVMKLTDLSVPTPIELGLIEGRDFMELHEEIFALPSTRPVDLAAVAESDALTFPLPLTWSPAVQTSDTLQYTTVFAAAGWTFVVILVDSGGSRTLTWTVPAGPALGVGDATSLMTTLATMGVGFDGATQVFTYNVVNDQLVITTVEGGSSVYLGVRTCDFVTQGITVFQGGVGAGVYGSDESLEVEVIDSAGTHSLSHAFSTPGVPPADMAALVAELNADSAFTDSGGSPVLVASAGPTGLQLSTVELGGTVSIAVDATSTSIVSGALPWTNLTGVGTTQVKHKVRLPAGRTWRNSATIEVMESSGIDFRLLAQAGDLLFIEEGTDAGGYVIGSVAERQLVLDRPLVDGSAVPVKSAADGSWDGRAADPGNKRFTATSNPFTTEDLGRYLTIYGSHNPAANGSYRISDIDTVAGSWAELDIPAGSFPADDAETSVLWVVSAAPMTDPAEAAAGGTELWGLRPFRIYSGVAGVWAVSAVSTSLDASLATFSVQDPNDLTHYPVDGQDQPFRIVRPGVQRVHSTVMAGQKEGSLYYADFLIYGLGSEDLYNLPGNTRLEMVFGTYKSDGYRYETEDTNLTFSPYERVHLHFSPSVIPVGSEDNTAARIPVDGQSVEVRYTWAPLVAQIQNFATSRQERVVCSDPLIRHFLPSYVAIQGTYRGGGDASALYTKVVDLIRGLDPLDELALAALEDILREAGATDWIHPSEIVAVTHDLDRRVVADRSEDRLGGEVEVYFNGSNRTSYFIPGADGNVDEDDGERITLTRESGRGVIR